MSKVLRILAEKDIIFLNCIFGECRLLINWMENPYNILSYPIVNRSPMTYQNSDYLSPSRP